MTADVLFFAVRNRIKSEERGSRGPIFLRLKVDPDLGSRPNLRHPVFPLQIKKMGDTGFEHVQESSGNSDVFKTSGAESGADAAGWHIPVAQDDPDLKKLIAAWGSLPAPMRAAICSIVQASCIASSCKSS